MRASRLPPALRASSTICAVLLLLATTSCVSAKSPSTTTTITSTPSPSDDPIDPNALSTGNSGLSNGAIAGISACGGIIFVFCIAVALFVWNRRATRDMPDVQELVLSDGDEVQAQRLQQQRRMMAGPLTSRISDGPCAGSPLTPPEAVYRTTKKGSDASDYDDLEKGGLDGVSGLRGSSGGRDWAEALDGDDDEAVLQAAVARVVSGKS